jgi:phosphoribosylglycinamide formyltransferase-1
MMKARAIVFLSGRGSNLQSLIERASAYEIVAVLSDKASAAGFTFAREAGIPSFSFPKANYAHVDDQKSALYKQAELLQADCILLAGYMQIIRSDFAKKWFGKVINIHPSLLPKYPGLSTHAQAIAAAERTHGCSVHFVDSGVDTGPLIAQASCPCLPTDTEASLAERVLALEHQLYPAVVNAFALGNIQLRGRSVHFDSGTQKDFLSQGFHPFSNSEEI